jgi:hypothetical protein
MMDALWGSVGFKFPNDAANALAIYGHSCTALLSFFFSAPSNLGNYGKMVVYSECHCLTLLSPLSNLNKIS